MKLIIAIIQEDDTAQVSEALLEAGYRVTKIASSGGFLRKGSATILIGVEEHQVEEALQLIRGHCAAPAEPAIKRGTVFVIPVERFEQL
ncbi:MAG TPA: hypothetical protein G4O04_07730 [Anaerolineae bacterium]|nr:hypothetical protein [Anaerolineae bacterium]HID85488.1 hypothetical protein [Anaerolineales bacterium]HIQ07974.1 hypothetical protein [Anaerolineaceae bacterium]